MKSTTDVPPGTSLGVREMTEAPHRRELAEFLRSRREALDPSSLGFAAGPRRRTPGLRREEVALLSGVSVTWYTWLEQQREIRVSRQVVDSLARALQLSAVERQYLFTLAGLVPPADDARRPEVSESLRRLVETLAPNPACITSPFFDLLAWNSSYDRFVGGLSDRSGPELNVVWLLFTEPERRAGLQEWDREARSLIGQLRASQAQHPDDPRGHALVEALRRSCSEFEILWAGHSVRAFQPAPVHFRHPEAGVLRLDTLKFASAEDGQQYLTVFLAGDDASLERLGRL
jgi:transcriptional regulator with XRE-family HTH domain